VLKVKWTLSRSIVGISYSTRKSIPFFFCTKPGRFDRLITEGEHQTYFQFPATYKTDRTAHAMLLIHRVDGDRDYKSDLTGHCWSLWNIKRKIINSRDSF